MEKVFHQVKKDSLEFPFDNEERPTQIGVGCYEESLDVESRSRGMIGLAVNLACDLESCTQNDSQNSS